ncbi:alkanesulfonate transporter permease [Shigella flexneri]|nr:alkanesulfonate transporter permease [Shigella flexneri]
MAVWQLASSVGWLSTRILPSPEGVVTAFWTLSASGELWQHLALIPLVILWFGIDESAKIFLVALGTLFPMRFALGLMWLTLIVAETISANSGIGYLAMNAREFLQTDVVVVAIILYALLGKLADVSAQLLERLWLSWNPAYHLKEATI